MDWSGLVITVIGLFLSGCGVVLWSLYIGVDRRAAATAKELADYQRHVAENYVTSNELSKALDTLSRAIDAVFKKLDRIDEKLDKKADK